MKWFPIFFYILCCGIQAKHPNHRSVSEELKPPSNLTDSNNSIEVGNANKNRSDSLESPTTSKAVEDKTTSKPGSNDSGPNEILKPGDHRVDRIKKNATIKKYYRNDNMVKTMQVFNTRYCGTYSPFNPFKLSTASGVSTQSYYGNGRGKHYGPWGSRDGYTRPEGWFPSYRNPGKFDFYLQPIKSKMNEFQNRGLRKSQYRLFKVNPCLCCGCHSHWHHKHSKKSEVKENEVQDFHPTEVIQGTIIEGKPKIEGHSYNSSSREKRSDFDDKSFNISHYNLKHPHRLSPDVKEKITKYLNGGKDLVFVVPGPPTPTYKFPKKPKPHWPLNNTTE